MPNCRKCGKKLVPDIDLKGETAEILARLAREADVMRWKCSGCGAAAVEGLRADEVAEVRSYIRRQKKQWWQFWIR
jgi:hypothetical protein